MKTFNTYINERLVLSKSKSSSIPLSIKPIKKHPEKCSWNLLVIETSVETLERLFGKPIYDCSKDSHFNFGVDKTSLSYYLNVTGDVENKNIDYGIFAQSFKSEIIVLQSIGRGLLKTENKDKFPIYDIIDVLPTKKLLSQ